MLLLSFFTHDDPADYIRAGLSRAEARGFLRSLLTALAGLHRLGLVHRDVKPANCLYHRASRRFLLTDFGLTHMCPTAAVPRRQLPVRPASQLARTNGVAGVGDAASVAPTGRHMARGAIPFAQDQQASCTSALRQDGCTVPCCVVGASAGAGDRKGGVGDDGDGGGGSGHPAQQPARPNRLVLRDAAMSACLDLL